MENIERDLLELKRQQLEIVETGIRVMFELSSKVEVEKQNWVELSVNKKMDEYSAILHQVQAKKN